MIKQYYLEKAIKIKCNTCKELFEVYDSNNSTIWLKHTCKLNCEYHPFTSFIEININHIKGKLKI